MNFVVAIPARYASTRLPGKPLLDIAGKPMIQRVYEQALLSGAKEVWVATDDSRIGQACEGFGAPCVMTRSDHESGTLRLAEVARLRGWEGSQIVVNVQGDEPLIPPALIRQVATVLEHTPQAAMATLMTPIDSAQELINPNVVKVVTTAQGLASYFTRAPVPWSRDDYAQGITATTPIRHAFRHIGIYAYRVEFLLAFGDLAPAPTEQIESLEQLRALYHGCAIAVEAACTLPGPGIDTPDDLERVRAILASH